MMFLKENPLSSNCLVARPFTRLNNPGDEYLLSIILHYPKEPTFHKPSLG